MEYLIVFSMAFLMTIPLIILFSVQTNNMKSDISNAQLSKLTSKIMDASEEVYYLGPPSKKVLEISFPNKIKNITIEPHALSIYVWRDKSVYSFYEDTLLNLTGSLRNSPGTRTVSVIATNSGVEISDE